MNVNWIFTAAHDVIAAMSVEGNAIVTCPVTGDPTVPLGMLATFTVDRTVTPSRSLATMLPVVADVLSQSTSTVKGVPAAGGVIAANVPASSCAIGSVTEVRCVAPSASDSTERALTPVTVQLVAVSTLDRETVAAGTVALMEVSAEVVPLASETVTRTTYAPAAVGVNVVDAAAGVPSCAVAVDGPDRTDQAYVLVPDPPAVVVVSVTGELVPVVVAVAETVTVRVAVAKA